MSFQSNGTLNFIISSLPVSLLGKVAAKIYRDKTKTIVEPLITQPLEKSDEKHDHKTVSKKFGTTPGSTKSSSTTLH